MIKPWPVIVRRTVTVSHITTGHGQSELGFDVTLNNRDDIDIPDLKPGDRLEVSIIRAEVSEDELGSYRRAREFFLSELAKYEAFLNRSRPHG